MAESQPSTDPTAHASAEWQRLRAWTRTVTPQAIGRGTLVTLVAVGIASLVVGTWPATLPFLVGALLAYAVLPLANALDKLLPRVVASGLAMLLVLAAIIGVFVVVLPPFARGIAALAEELPSRPEIDAWIASVTAALGEVEGFGPRLAALLGAMVEAIRINLGSSSGDLTDLANSVLQGAIGALTAIIGLLVLPTWMLTLVHGQRRGGEAIRASLPAWLRNDTWAVVRIFDRAGSTYLRGIAPLAFLVGLGTWLGLGLADRLGLTVFQQTGAVAVFAGAVQVIPEIGPLIGFLPALLALPLSVETSVAYLASYLASRWLAGAIMGRTGKARRLHPVIMIPGIVALTQLGWLWLFIAGPILAVGFDLVRYTYGRLSEPAKPAGLIPDEQPAPTAATAATATQGRQVPWATSVTTRG